MVATNLQPIANNCLTAESPYAFLELTAVLLCCLLLPCSCVLQGNVIEKLPDYLMATYGIPKKYFLVKK
jgi:hypothetical protein